MVTEDYIWKLLNEVPDPEIPVLSIIDLGIVRQVDIEGKEVQVTITPTYTGCPAMAAFEKDIKSKLHQNGIDDVAVKTIFHPAWTTDWITNQGKKKLKDYGIAPPGSAVSNKEVLFCDEVKPIPCPRCEGSNTILQSQFGSTACKALHFCNDCIEPFEHFKCL